MENLNQLIEVLRENFETLFSGAGTEAIKLLFLVIAGVFAWIKKNTIVRLISNMRKNHTQPNEPSPLHVSAPTKNKLTKPIIKIECISYGGTRGVSQFAQFKITNQGGSAYDVEVSGECLPKKIYLGDILRQRDRNFRVDLSPHDHWETLDFQIHYLDRDGDEGRQGLWLRWEIGGRGYVVPE
ncbi:hypothetical protein [Pseudomonas corrugata]|uniref:hypothetical protein n=1 Tax=Pseudomonas corrugata TaxID=47879 RepID=UPI0006D8A29C|nr:hypothetical protein [Pseudomonas corrugata]